MNQKEIEFEIQIINENLRKIREILKELAINSPQIAMNQAELDKLLEEIETIG